MSKFGVDPSEAPTKKQTAKYDMLSPMLDSAILEMREFSKKKQDGIVNTTKINIINRLLRDLKEVLANEPSTGYLDLLDEESLPQNSDAVLILGQYRAAMNRFHARHFKRSDYGQGGYWITKEYLEEKADEEEYEDEDDEYDDDEDSEEGEDE
jgi:hypothetical protein